MTASPTPQPPKRRRRGCGCACAVVVLVTIGLLVWSLILFNEGMAIRDRKRRNLENASQLLMALQKYASNHGGSYPDDLNQIVSEGIMSKEGFSKCNRVILDAGGPDADWIYMRGLNASSRDYSVVIISPPTSRTPGTVEKYIDGLLSSSEHHPYDLIVGLTDGSASIMPRGGLEMNLRKTGQTLPRADAK